MLRLLAATSAIALLAGCFEPVDPRTARDAAARPDVGGEVGLDAARPDANDPPDAGAPLDAGPTLLPCESWTCDAARACSRQPKTAGVVCRPAEGLCDQAETCDGVSAECPPDLLEPKATYCGSNSWCDGISTVCPPGTGAWETFPGSHFYWEYPRPTSENLFALWVVAEDDVWVGGGAGLLMHWDGKAWTHVPSGTTSRINDIWGPASNDLWAVGFGKVVLHWDGMAWTPVATPFSEPFVFNGVWGTSSQDLWLVGFDHSNPSTDGSTLPTGPGVIARFDGQAWTAVKPEGAKALVRVTGTSAADVWAFDGSSALHWDGTAWTPVAGCGADAWSPDSSGMYCTFKGHLLERTGTTWTKLASDPILGAQSIWGTSQTDIWIAGADCFGACSGVGSFAAIDHWDGAKLERELSDDGGELTKIRGSGPDDVWAVGIGGRLLHWNGSGWTSSTEKGCELFWGGVHGSSPSNVWALGGKYERPPQFDYSAAVAGLSNTGWERIEAPGLDHAWALWAGAENDVWTADRSGAVAHWDGSRWTKSVVDLTASLWSLWGFSGDDVWAVGYTGDHPNETAASFHWDGSQWTNIAVGLPPETVLLGLWGSSDSDLWAAGSRILHWDGNAWTAAFDPGPLSRLNSISGSSSADIWAVGGTATVSGGLLTQGYAAHWDGSSWTVVSVGDVFPLGTVWAAGPSDVWASGSNWPLGRPWPPDSYRVIHWDGASWSMVETGIGGLVDDIWGSSPDDIWFAAGGLIHYKR
ncbi:MAG TPA: hypothetical protein VGK67_12875 [Myxococcales bacterium]|jgi:hypothetical protein